MNIQDKQDFIRPSLTHRALKRIGNPFGGSVLSAVFSLIAWCTLCLLAVFLPGGWANPIPPSRVVHWRALLDDKTGRAR